MPRGDLGEFFLKTAAVLGNQRANESANQYRNAQTGAILQKLEDDKAMAEAMSGIDPNQYNNPYEAIGIAAERATNPRVKAGLLEKYGTIKESHFKNLDNFVMNMKDDPDTLNKYIQSPEMADYRKYRQIPEGFTMNVGKQEFERKLPLPFDVYDTFTQATIPKGTKVTLGMKNGRGVEDAFEVDEQGRRVLSKRATRFDVEEEKPDAWQPWGSGQMRNKETGKIVEVPVAPQMGVTIIQTDQGLVPVYTRGPNAGKILPPISKKPLDATRQEKINTKADKVSQYTQLLEEFDDSYAGGAVFGFGGSAKTAIQEKTGSNIPRTEWWKEFKMLDNKIRNELFGSALTGTEKQEWAKATFNENSHPDIVRKNLAKRTEILKKALERDVSGLSKSGYSTEGIGLIDTTNKKPNSNAVPSKLPNETIDEYMKRIGG